MNSDSSRIARPLSAPTILEASTVGCGVLSLAWRKAEKGSSMARLGALST